jgi:cytochrome P450
MFAYLWELLERKEGGPGDDLMSRLVTDYVATGRLNRATAAANGVIMMQAGHETTANMIALGTVALLEHREVFDRLGRTDDRAVVANTVEELMRYLTIVHSEVERVARPRTSRSGISRSVPATSW